MGVVGLAGIAGMFVTRSEPHQSGAAPGEPDPKRAATGGAAQHRRDRVIIVAGVPFGTPGATNMVRIAFTGSER